MGDDIEIRVTGSDRSGPATESATRNARSLGSEVTKTATSMAAASRTAGRLSDALDEVAGSTKGTAVGADRAKVSVDGLGGSATAASHELDGMRADAARLDRQIDETAASVRDLARSIAAAGDEAERAELSKKLSVEQGRLREQKNLRKLLDVDSMLPDAVQQGGQLGAALGRGIGDAAGPAAASGLMSQLTAAASAAGPAAAIGAPLGAGIAAWLGASISAAIIGGAGIGGVVGGLKIAAKHSEVKSSATALGAEFEATMQQSAVAFVPAAVQGIGVIRSHLGEAREDLAAIFASTSRLVVPLAEGAGQAVRSVLGGVRDLAENAEPVIHSIADGMARIGRAAGDGLSSLADNADSGARALSILFLLVEQGVRGFFALTTALAETWEMIEIGGAALTGNTGKLMTLLSETERGEQVNGGFAQSIDEILSGFRQEGDAAGDATQALREYADAADRIVDQNLDAAEATLRYRDTLRDVQAAADGRRRVSDAESESLIRLARQSNNLTDALEEQGATTGELAARQRTARADFVRTAMAMGHSRSAAQRLADQYLKVPRRVSTDIRADTGQAARNLRSVRDLIAQIRSKRVVVTTVIRSEGRNVPIGDGVGGRAHGGITGAASGGIRSNLTWVGESGPELVELPPSTTVHPAGTSQRMMAAAQPQHLTVRVEAGGAGTSTDRAVSGMLLNLIRTGALQLVVRNDQVQVA